MSQHPNSEPFDLFHTWFAEAEAEEPNDPNAMALATVGADGQPSVRMVLLKDADPRGFVFYTNYESRKGRQLAGNPQGGAACCIGNRSAARCGSRARSKAVTEAEADAYFASRHRIQPDRRLGLAAIAPAGKPVRAGKARRRVHREIRHRRGAAAALLVGLPADARTTSSSGRTSRSGCTTGWSTIAPARAGRRRSSIRDEHGGIPEQGRLMRLASFASVGAALLLIVLKFGAFLETGSVSLLSTLFDSALDAAASIVNLIAVRQCADPGGCASTASATARRSRWPAWSRSPSSSGSSIAPAHGGGRSLRRSRSRSSSARDRHRGDGDLDGRHRRCWCCCSATWCARPARSPSRPTRCTTAADFLVNASVIVALVLSARFGWWWADPAIGLAIADLHRVGRLADRQGCARHADGPRDGRRRSASRIKEIVRGHPEVLNLHDLRTRAAGPRQVHPVPSGAGRRAQPDRRASHLRRGRGRGSRGLSRRRGHHSRGSGRRGRAARHLPVSLRTVEMSGETKKTVVLTGASRGIGHATVKRFSQEGWRVHHLLPRRDPG